MIKSIKSKLLTYLFTDWVKTETDLEFFNRISNDTTLIICALGGNLELEISKEDEIY